MEKPMDLLGEALCARIAGDRSKFYFIEGDGRMLEHDLGRYFRSYEQLTKTEQKLIQLSGGNILDVGCSTGYYLPALSKKGNVLGIDISKRVIEAALSLGCKKCMVADIYRFSPGKRFDTITLLENNIGLGDSLEMTRRLLTKLASLLAEGGQILAVCRTLPGREYRRIVLRPVWKDKKGAAFGWMQISSGILSRLCREQRLCLEVLQANRYWYLARITKSV